VNLQRLATAPLIAAAVIVLWLMWLIRGYPSDTERNTDNSPIIFSGSTMRVMERNIFSGLHPNGCSAANRI
jgi:hypothetical protein